MNDEREPKELGLERSRNFCFAASGSVLLDKAALERLVDSFVGRCDSLDIALAGCAHALERPAQGGFARVVVDLAPKALAMRFLCGLGNCHGEIVLYICMIGKLTGRFGGASGDGTIIVEVGGVGYCVRAPALFAASLSGSAQEITLFIHTAVREDAIDLYGFAAEGDLAFFRELLNVSGIGPKSALGILNIAEPDALKRSIAQGDSSVLTKVFGIGKKSAERIVVELRDKLADAAALRGEAVGAGRGGEVIEALMALGYSAAEARGAVQETSDAAPAQADVRERLALALKHLGSTKK